MLLSPSSSTSAESNLLHISDRLKIGPMFCGERDNVNLDLLFIVLVVTIIDPSYRQREYTQDACSGTLVRADLVVTAASCLIHSSNQHPSPLDTFVCVRGGGNFKAIRIYLHPEFSREKENFNVALIDIEKTKVTVFPTLPAKFIDIEDLIKSGKCKVSGYGNLMVRLTVVNFEVMVMQKFEEMECRGNPPSLMCLHFDNMQPCNGDIGSPIVCENELYAIFTPETTVDPRTCVDRSGITFTKIVSIKDWIEKIGSAHNLDMEWMSNPVYILLLSGAILLFIIGIYCLIKLWMEKKFELLGFSASLTSTKSPDENIPPPLDTV